MRVVCKSKVPITRVKVPSASGPEPRVVEVVGGVASCSCPGFKFRKECRHMEVVVAECGWDSSRSGTRQKEAGVCPLCGSSTVRVPSWRKASSDGL